MQEARGIHKSGVQKESSAWAKCYSHQQMESTEARDWTRSLGSEVSTGRKKRSEDRAREEQPTREAIQKRVVACRAGKRVSRIKM